MRVLDLIRAVFTGILVQAKKEFVWSLISLSLQVCDVSYVFRFYCRGKLETYENDVLKSDVESLLVREERQEAKNPNTQRECR